MCSFRVFTSCEQMNGIILAAFAQLPPCLERGAIQPAYPGELETVSGVHFTLYSTTAVDFHLTANVAKVWWLGVAVLQCEAEQVINLNVTSLPSF